MAELPTLSKYYGARIVEIVAAQRRSPSGVLAPLAADATLFPFVVRTSGSAVFYDPIPSHTVRRLSPSEIAAVDYTSDKSAATFFELTFAGGAEIDAFAMRESVQINIFQGTTQADMEVVAKPHIIKRIASGDETLVEP